jgi:nucleotide-binding universal stress UspA family protein
MHILIPISSTIKLEALVQLGTLVHQMVGGTITLLAVIKNENGRPQAEALLDQAKKLSETADSNLKTRLRTGQLLEEIVDEVTSGAYDLLIVRERPQRKFLRRFTTPVTDHLLAHTDCPVLLSRGEARPLDRVLVCESGREPTLLDWLTSHMLSLLNQIDELTILHVMSQIAAGPGVAGWELRADAKELIQKHTPEGSLLEEDLAQLEPLNVRPKAKVRHGLVVQEILAEAQNGDYDLVVIGAHSGEGWERFLLDDLAHEIIAQVARPLLVMKR